MWKHVLISLLFSFIFNVHAVQGATFYDAFDTYTPGSLDGQGPWAYASPFGTTPSISVSTAQATTSANSAYLDSGLRPLNPGMATSTNVKMTYYVYLDATGKTDASNLPTPSFNDNTCNSVIDLYARTDGYLRLNFGGPNSPNQYIEDAWNKIEIQYGIFDGIGYLELKLNDDTQFVQTSTSSLPSSVGAGCMHGYSVGANPVDSYVDNLSILTGADAPTPEIFDDRTRIISFSPLDGSTVTSPVTFELEAYINENDIGTVQTIQLTFENIDQNVLLLGFLSPNQITFVDINVDNAGFFNYSTTTPIGDGNYRIEACIKRTFFGLSDSFSLVNLFSDISDCQSHQFIVGTSTFIGSVQSQIWGETNAFLEGLTATSSEALAASCNPISSAFDIRQCFVFLTVPDSASLSATMTNARDAILTRWPWGYATRFVQILTSPATSSLPTVSLPILTGTGQDTTLTFDFGDMVAGGGSLLEQAHDPISGKSVREVFQPFVVLFFALLVVIIIVNDLMKMGRDRDSYETKSNKYN